MNADAVGHFDELFILGARAIGVLKACVALRLIVSEGAATTAREIVSDWERITEPPAPVPAPVTVVACPICHGDGQRETGINPTSGIGRSVRCACCAGRGRIATEGGEP